MSVRDRILNTAWARFMEKGYENTTVDEIIQLCGISKGGFYHYFSSKDDLLVYLSTLFDEQYESLSKTVDPELSAKEKLFYYTENLFIYIEDHIPYDILALVFSTQVVKSGSKHLLDERRRYFSILTEVISSGKKSGEFNRSKTTRELVKLYAMQERSVLYDWCMCEGNYPLATYGVSIFKEFISGVLKGESEC